MRYLIFVMIFVINFGCFKRKPATVQNETFISVFADYLFDISQKSMADSQKAALLDSICKSHKYSIVEFKIQIQQLNNKPEDWGQVMEMIKQRLIIQKKQNDSAGTKIKMPTQNGQH